MLLKEIIVLHFDEKYASLPLPTFEELWQMQWGTKQTTSCYGVSRNSSPLGPNDVTATKSYTNTAIFND